MRAVRHNKVSEEFVKRVDDFSSAVLTYFGFAVAGSLSSDNVWQILRIDETTGIIETFADGNANFDNVWDNRLSLTYT